MDPQKQGCGDALQANNVKTPQEALDEAAELWNELTGQDIINILLCIPAEAVQAHSFYNKLMDPEGSPFFEHIEEHHVRADVIAAVQRHPYLTSSLLSFSSISSTDDNFANNIRELVNFIFAQHPSVKEGILPLKLAGNKVEGYKRDQFVGILLNNSSANARLILPQLSFSNKTKIGIAEAILTSERLSHFKKRKFIFLLHMLGAEVLEFETGDLKKPRKSNIFEKTPWHFFGVFDKHLLIALLSAGSEIRRRNFAEWLLQDVDNRRQQYLQCLLDWLKPARSSSVCEVIFILLSCSSVPKNTFMAQWLESNADVRERFLIWCVELMKAEKLFIVKSSNASKNTWVLDDLTIREGLLILAIIYLFENSSDQAREKLCDWLAGSKEQLSFFTSFLISHMICKEKSKEGYLFALGLDARSEKADSIDWRVVYWESMREYHRNLVAVHPAKKRHHDAWFIQQLRFPLRVNNVQGLDAVGAFDAAYQAGIAPIDILVCLSMERLTSANQDIIYDVSEKFCTFLRQKHPELQREISCYTKLLLERLVILEREGDSESVSRPLAFLPRDEKEQKERIEMWLLNIEQTPRFSLKDGR